MSMSRYNVVELYAGTARSSEPFQSWRRAKISLLVDNDSFALRNYKVNYPKAPYLCRDIGAMSPGRWQLVQFS